MCLFCSGVVVLRRPVTGRFSASLITYNVVRRPLLRLRFLAIIDVQDSFLFLPCKFTYILFLLLQSFLLLFSSTFFSSSLPSSQKIQQEILRAQTRLFASSQSMHFAVNIHMYMVWKLYGLFVFAVIFMIFVIFVTRVRRLRFSQFMCDNIAHFYIKVCKSFYNLTFISTLFILFVR